MKQFFYSVGSGCIVGLVVAFSPDQVAAAAGIIVLHITWMHYEK